MTTAGEPVSPLTALALNVPEAEACVAALRERYDPSSAIGVPAHITILYPFMPPSAIDDAVLRQVGEVLSSFRAFGFRLRRIARFPGVVYLAPEPDQAMKDLTRALAARFTAYPPYGGQHADVVPHLTVAQATEPELAVAERELRARLPAEGLAARCTEVVMMENASGLWRPMHRFPLAQEAGLPAQRSPLAEALLRRLGAEFAGRPMHFPPGGEVLVIFPAMHPEVGDAAIAGNGDELVLHLGKFTHIHFAGHEKPRARGPGPLLDEVVDFLRELFADRIVFHGTGRAGAWHPRTARKRGALSRFLLGNTTYVWSGPLAAGDE